MYSRILVPLDGTDLAERALQQAEEIGQCVSGEIILLQAIHDPLAKTPEAGQRAEEGATREAADEALGYLQRAAAPLIAKGLKVRSEVQEGEPAAAILDTAHKEDVDLIVMSTHCRGELAKLAVGSVAEKVLFTTKRPVMLVKPERIHREHHVDEQEVFTRKTG